MNISRPLIIIVFIVISSGAYTSCTDNKIFVHTMKQQVDKIYLIEKKRNRELIYIKLQEIIRNNINLKEISRFVMGKHWTLSPKEERENFLKEYEIYLARLCTKILDQYINKSKMTIMDSKASEDGTCLVSTRFFFYGKEKFTNIDFKVAKINSSYLINDIVMNGISISISQRSKFSEKIDRYGLSSVINELKFNNSL